MPLGSWFRSVIEGSLEVKLPTYGKCSNSVESSQRTERLRRERVSRKKIMVNEKVEKSRNTVLFPCFVAPEVGLLKRRVKITVGSEHFWMLRRKREREKERE